MPNQFENRSTGGVDIMIFKYFLPVEIEKNRGFGLKIRTAIYSSRNLSQHWLSTQTTKTRKKLPKSGKS
jgi:hypothetical protein